MKRKGSSEKIAKIMAERLEEAMKIRKISQTELSQKTGISQSSISEHLQGKNAPNQDKIFSYANVLEVSIDWLFGVDVEMSRKDKMLLTKDEQDIIDKFRLLDQHGLQMVSYVLEAEFEPLYHCCAAYIFGSFV